MGRHPPWQKSVYQTLEDHSTNPPGHGEGLYVLLVVCFTLTERPLWHVGILQGGGDVEEAEAFKYRWFHRCHAEPFATCVRVDAEWNSNTVSE